MTTCSKFCLHLITISSILLLLSECVFYSSSETINCSSDAISTETWQKDTFPNPQVDVSRCGRNCTKSWICDPGHILTSQNGDDLDALIEKVATSGKCTCSNCSSIEGYNIAVAIVPLIDKSTRPEDFANYLLTNWNFQKCNNNILILISQENKKVYTETGQNTNAILTSSCIDEVNKKIEQKLSDGKYYYVLNEMITQYKIILSVGNCDYILHDRNLTIASIASGASFGMAVLLFSFVALLRHRKDGPCSARYEDGKQYLKQHKKPLYHTNPSYDENGPSENVCSDLTIAKNNEVISQENTKQ